MRSDVTSDDEKAARLIREVLDSVDMHDATFTVPALRSALVACHDYLNGAKRSTALLWNLRRILGKCIENDAKEAGE